jgi:hypothetical protein
MHCPWAIFPGSFESNQWRRLAMSKQMACEPYISTSLSAYTKLIGTPPSLRPLHRMHLSVDCRNRATVHSTTLGCLRLENEEEGKKNRSKIFPKIFCWVSSASCAARSGQYACSVVPTRLSPSPSFSKDTQAPSLLTLDSTLSRTGTLPCHILSLECQGETLLRFFMGQRWDRARAGAHRRRGYCSTPPSLSLPVFPYFFITLYTLNQSYSCLRHTDGRRRQSSSPRPHQRPGASLAHERWRPSLRTSHVIPAPPRWAPALPPLIPVEYD